MNLQKTGVLEAEKPLNLDSTFSVASCKKLMTTIAALQCVEKSLFSLDSPEDVGGAGVYSTPKDFNILSSFLRDDWRLLRSESIDEMFRPQLSSTIIADWMKKERFGFTRWKGVSRVYTAKDDMKVNWGPGSMLILEDLESELKKRSLTWGDMPNLHWLSDLFLR